MTDLSDADIGKDIYTAEEEHIGTLQAIDYPTIYIQLAEDIDDGLRSDMKISETTAYSHEGKPLAGAPLAAVEKVVDEEIYFWPAYAAEARHESIQYDEIPQEEGHEDL